MAKNPHDFLTVELEGIGKIRGRKPAGKAKSNADRLREYRKRKLAEGGRRLGEMMVSPACGLALEQLRAKGKNFTLPELVEAAIRLLNQTVEVGNCEKVVNELLDKNKE